jgi:large subunit ribosomal protein L30
MLAAIRIRGRAKKEKEVNDTLEMLRLKRTNWSIIIPDTKSYVGMLKKVRHMVTWGEIDKDTLILLLKKRLRLKKNKRVGEKELKERFGTESFEALADAILSKKIELSKFKGIQPVFRLTPPSKGFKNVKEFYPKGDLGYRGVKINKLLRRML